MASLFPLIAQGMLMGCQLVGGQLDCVPGMNHLTPQQQIKVLKQQTDTAISEASALQGAINRLGQLVLSGEALIGSLIAAEWLNANGGAMQPSAIHWYRQGDNGWVLISETATTSYTIQPQDLGLELMAVAIVVTPEGHQRIASTPVGPVTGP